MIYKKYFRDIPQSMPEQASLQEQVDSLIKRVSSGIDGTIKVKGNDTGWNVTNVTEDKVFDADATTVAELADVLGTLIARLKAVGLISN